MADLRAAPDLLSRLRGRTFRDYLFSETEPHQITDPRQRRLAAEYRRFQRETFGVHGTVLLAKAETLLRLEEPNRFERWVRTARLAVEAGCGEGHYVEAFASRFERLIVVDLSYLALVQASKLAEDAECSNVEFYAADVEKLPLPDGSVDFFHCNNVLEHVAHPRRAVSESARVLRPGGVAYFVSPNHYSVLI